MIKYFIVLNNHNYLIKSLIYLKKINDMINFNNFLLDDNVN